MLIINAAKGHFITQTNKKSETALKNFQGPGGRGAEGRENKYPGNTRKYFS